MTQMNKMKVNLMVDLETLGTTPGSTILSIAAVPFNLIAPIESFYTKINAESCSELGFHVDDDTIAWWNKQSKAAYEEAFSGTLLIDDALLDFANYCEALGEVVIWGNGADFDNVLLSEAFRICGMKTPWKYSNSRCYRTLKSLYPQVIYTKPELAHHALHDARAQAHHAEKILHWIETRK